METRTKYEADFQALQTTQKGNLGERIAKGIIKASQWLIYEITADTPHSIDFLCHKPGKGLIAVDVKCYPRRAYYIDTGIDLDDFIEYQAFGAACGVDVYLMFIDEVETAVYGAWLSRLDRRATLDGNKVYFPLSAMHLHRYLNTKELAALRQAGGIDAARYADVERYFVSRHRQPARPGAGSDRGKFKGYAPPTL